MQPFLVRASAIPTFCACLVLLFAALPAVSQPVAFDLVSSTSSNLVSFTDDALIPFGNPGDGFQRYRRGVSATIPFSVLDDSLATFPGDTLGIVDDNNLDEFFGVTDTVNSDNATSRALVAEWVFDVSSAVDPLVLSIDMGAMGDFEANDVFTWSSSFDGVSFDPVFVGSADESSSLTYVLASGTTNTLNDPMTVNGLVLSNVLQTVTAPILGGGATLTLRLEASTDGGSEAFAFQNIVIAESTPELRISEIMYNPNSSEDDWEWVEITNVGAIPVDLAGWVIDDENSSAHAASNIAGGVVAVGATAVLFNADDLSAADFEAAWGTGINLVPVTGWSRMALNNGGDRIGLWSSFTSYVGDQIAHANTVVDVDYDDGGSWPTDDNSASIFLVDLSADANDGANWARSTEAGPTPNFLGYRSLSAGGNSGNDVGSPGPADFPPPQFTELEIFEIQGNGPASPVEGQSVRSLDNVVTALALNGFFLQTPPERTDGDVDSSDGIFVFSGAAPVVAVGDRVNVEGVVDEFFGFTEIVLSAVTVVGSSAVPSPVVFDASVPSSDPSTPSCSIEFECYEGMLIDVAAGVVTGPNQSFGSDPIAEVYISAAGRSFREPGIEFPGLPGLPVWDGNPEVFELDPDKLGLTNQVLDAGTTFSATGVLGFEFGGYELWPTNLTVTSAPTIPGAVRVADASELTIGTLNLFRLFDDVDDPGTEDDGQVPTTAEYQVRLDKLARYVVDVLRAPGVLAAQEVENLNALSDLATAVSVLDPTVAYTAHLVEGNDVGGIDVGFLTRDFVAVDAVTQLGATEILTFDGSLLHDRPPLLLEGRCQNGGTDFPVAVLAVHNRSLGGIDGSSGDRVRQKRFEQAQSIATMVQGLQTAQPDVKLVVTGDFNAFEFSDGYVDVVGQIAGDFDPSENLLSGPDLVDPNLTVETDFVAAQDRYSFIFRGSSQVLDHALTSAALASLVTGFEFGRANADVSEIFEFDPGNPLRSSDHDGAVLFVLKDSDLDGILDGIDQCAGTTIPEGIEQLQSNRFALFDDDGVFDTKPPNGKGPQESFTIEDTAGCSCTQIAEELGLGLGQAKFGCPVGVMRNWVDSISP